MLRQWLARLVDPAFVMLRVVAGLMFAQHGVQKLFGVLGGKQQPIASQLGVGGIIELVAGLCIALGIQPVWAALIASGQMAVAYLQFHWKLDFGARFFPVVNQGELALLYCFVFFFIACRSALAGKLASARKAGIERSSEGRVDTLGSAPNKATKRAREIVL